MQSFLGVCGCAALLACSVPAAKLNPLETSSAGGTAGVGSGSAATNSGTSSSTSSNGTTTGTLCTPLTPTTTEGPRFSCDLRNGTLFGDPIRIDTGVQYASSWHPMVVADVNADGNLDLIETDLGSGDVVVMFGNGDGTFEPPVHSSVLAQGTSSGPTSLTVAPLGDPAIPSLVVADEASSSLLVEGIQPNGQLTNLATLAIDDGGWSYALVADLNCDGIPDLVNADSSNRVTAFLGTDAGTYVQSGTVDQPGYSQCLGDFNEDGILDVIVEPDFQVFLGAGDGTFSDAGIGTVMSAIAGENVWLIGDVNEDGHLDLLVESVQSASHAVLLGKGDGTFSLGPSPASLTAAWTDMLQDLNGDGHLDYVGDGDEGVLVALGKGNGTFGRQMVLPTGSVWSVVAGDLNNDGRPDLIVSDRGDSDVLVFLNNCR